MGTLSLVLAANRRMRYRAPVRRLRRLAERAVALIFGRKTPREPKRFNERRDSRIAPPGTRKPA
jgi:hypothetical protein